MSLYCINHFLSLCLQIRQYIRMQGGNSVKIISIRNFFSSSAGALGKYLNIALFRCFKYDKMDEYSQVNFK